jgi:large subunit ribosomal protein L4
MAKARYYKADGTEGGSRELPGALFDGVVNEDVLHQVVKAHLANQRQGTAAAKNRSAVRGGSRKPWRQKGTGRARQGSIRAVQWAGGGRAFPPIPHSWRQKLPRRVKALARRSAFNVRAGDDRIVVAELPRLEAPRTREMRSFLESLGVVEGRVLILSDGVRRTLHLSVRNLPGVEILPFGGESAYDLLRADIVILEESALEGVGDEAPPARGAARTEASEQGDAEGSEASTSATGPTATDEGDAPAAEEPEASAPAREDEEPEADRSEPVTEEPDVDEEEKTDA